MKHDTDCSFLEARALTFTTAAVGLGAAAIGAAGSIGGGLLSSSAAKKASKLSSQEKRAYEQQYWQMQAAKRWQELMQPFILEELGLSATYDENNNIVSIARKDVTTPGEKMKERIGLEAGAQAERALKGELPMDPATERDIRLSRIRLGDQVRRTFGPAGDLSSGGRVAMNAQAESEGISRSRFNRDQLAQLEGIFSRSIGDPEARRMGRASAMSAFPRNVMDFAQIMPEGPFAQGMADRFGARQDAQIYGHMGNIFGRAGTDIAQSINDWRRRSTQATTTTPYYAPDPSGGATDLPGGMQGYL